MFQEVMKCGTGLDAGILGHGTDIEYLMPITTKAMAMVTLRGLCPERGSYCGGIGRMAE